MTLTSLPVVVEPLVLLASTLDADGELGEVIASVENESESLNVEDGACGDRGRGRVTSAGFLRTGPPLCRLPVHQGLRGTSSKW